MRAMPNEEIPSTYAEKKNKIVEGTPRRLYPISPSMRPTYAGTGRVISGHDMVNRLEVDLEKTKYLLLYNSI